MGSPALAGAGQAPSWLKRPSALRLTGLLSGRKGSISTTQPKVLKLLRWSSAALAPLTLLFQRWYCSPSGVSQP